MRNDIYNRSEIDPNFVSDQLELDDTLEQFKQQIESCLFTTKTSVLGSIDMGASLEEFIWSYRTSAAELNYVISEQISEFCTLSRDYPYKVDTTFYAGSIRDIAEINIEIDNRDKFNILIS
jgi:hypothetical protein